MSDDLHADYSDFSLVSGGLIYKLTSVFRKNAGKTKGLIRTALALSFITWIPLCIISLIEGTFSDSGSTISFLEDFQIHVSLLFVIPFLILIENFIDKAFVGFVENSDFIIPNTQQDRFNKLVKKLDDLSNSYIPEVLFLVIIYLLIFINWNSLSIFDSGRFYFIDKSSHTLKIAGWYYLLIGMPVFQLLIVRWLWRGVIWVYSMIRISRFKLKIDPLHADIMAGLEYINIVPLAFSYILLAPSAMLSAHIGIELVYNDAAFMDYVMPVAAYIFVLPIVFFSPLLLFIPFVLEAKSYGIRRFGNLIRRHNMDYRRVWIEGKGKKGEELLGTMDNSSLSDINGSYAGVQDMQLFPINLKILILAFVINIVPFIPLVFTYYTGSELFSTFLNSIMGG